MQRLARRPACQAPGCRWNRARLSLLVQAQQRIVVEVVTRGDAIHPVQVSTVLAIPGLSRVGNLGEVIQRSSAWMHRLRT
jgi:hypothetical protein